MFWGVVAKQAILGASSFAVGVLFYRSLFFERRRHRPFLATGFAGVGLVILLVAEAVVRAPLIDPDWRILIYIAALIAITIGFIGDAVREKRRPPLLGTG